MSVAAQHRQRAEREQAKKVALARIVDRIAGQFPAVSAEQIEQVIHGRYEALADARVRDFIPVLVERQGATRPRVG